MQVLDQFVQKSSKVSPAGICDHITWWAYKSRRVGRKWAHGSLTSSVNSKDTGQSSKDEKDFGEHVVKSLSVYVEELTEVNFMVDPLL